MKNSSLDQTLPRITPGEVWHEKAMRNPMRDSLMVIVFSLCCACVVVGALFANTVFHPETVQKAEAVSFSEDAAEHEFDPPKEPEPVIVEEAETVVEEVQYAEPQVGYSGGGYSNSFMRDGIVYGEDGSSYTWYSQNVLPGSGLTELNSNGRHVDGNGFVCDGDGYIAIAAPDNTPIGTVVDTPFGQGKVYDYNPGGGSYDVYTNF